ncbi:MAG: hypothetical protein FWD55_04305 [Propionibacteriaceae bacterium]|nr:hypothetical protein [Propionibacteriaceae bacterium]
MKKLFSATLAVGLLLSISGCSVIFPEVIGGDGRYGVNGEPSAEPVATSSAPEETQQVTSALSSFTMSFPLTWEKLDLNDAASIEMGRSNKDQYLIVIEDVAEDFDSNFTLEDFTDIVLGNLIDMMETATDPQIVDFMTTRGISGKQVEFAGVVDKIRVKYLLTTIQKNDVFYQILAWSTQSKYDAAKPVFDDILDSVGF